MHESTVIKLTCAPHQKQNFLNLISSAHQHLHTVLHSVFNIVMLMSWFNIQNIFGKYEGEDGSERECDVLMFNTALEIELLNSSVMSKY